MGSIAQLYIRISSNYTKLHQYYIKIKLVHIWFEIHFFILVQIILDIDNNKLFIFLNISDLARGRQAALRPPLLPPLHLRRGHGKYSQGLQRLPGHYPAGPSQNVRDPLKAFPQNFPYYAAAKNYLLNGTLL